MQKLVAALGLFISLLSFADGTHQQDQNSVYLTKKDIYELALSVRAYFDGSAESVLIPHIADGYSPVKNASVAGQIGKMDFSLGFENGEQIDFKSVKLGLNKVGRGGFGEFSLIAICSGSECDKIFVTVFIRENGEFTYNFPLVFKKENGNYVRALQKAEQENDSSQDSEKDTPNIPPQARVAMQLEAELDQHGDAVVDLVRERMEKRDAAYSALFFLGMNTPGIQIEFSKQGSELNISASAHYFSKYNRKDLDFSAVIQKNPVVVNLPTAKSNLEIVPVDGTNLLLLMFSQDDYKSILPGVNHGMSAAVCSVLIDNDVPYSECQLVPSSIVLGTIAIEGKVNGPIYVKDGEIINEQKK